MMITLSITNKITVTPLFDIQTAAFADSYRNGVWCSLYGEGQGKNPLPDSYLVDNLKREASVGMFHGQHSDSLSYLGFYFGMVHSGILIPHTGQPRRGVTALVTFTHCDSRCGYHIARGEYYHYAETASLIRTDRELIEAISHTAQDHLTYPDDPDSWYYSVGCLLGSQSVPLFPATDQEWQRWSMEHSTLLAEIHRNTQPLDPITVVALSVRLYVIWLVQHCQSSHVTRRY